MELWVRSQDKTTLSKITEISFDNDFIMGKNDNQVFTFLGQYDTKERCLEILDEIQKILCDTVLLVNGSGKETLDNLYGNGIAIMNGNEKIEQLGTYVYQMPEK